MTWSRQDVALGQVYVREGLAYRVVAICDLPTVTLVPLDERDGEDEEHYAIPSPLFAEFRRLETRADDGAIEPFKAAES